jgi:hypothetical protein
MVRGHEIRTCYNCGASVHVYNSDARAGAGKYCSPECASLAKSWYPKIMKVLPATAHAIGDELGISHHSAGTAVKRMIDKDLAHVAGLAPNPVATKPGIASMSLLYDAGPQPDPDVPQSNMRATLSYFCDKAILAAMPGTKAQLIERTGFTETTVTKRLIALRAKIDADGQRVHTFIRSWRRPSKRQGPFVAVHQVGTGRDQPCKLVPRTQVEKYQRWKAKRERNGTMEVELEKRRKAREHRKIILAGDPFLNALYGPPKQRRAGGAT